MNILWDQVQCVYAEVHILRTWFMYAEVLLTTCLYRLSTLLNTQLTNSPSQLHSCTIANPKTSSWIKNILIDHELPIIEIKIVNFDSVNILLYELIDILNCFSSMMAYHSSSKF